MSLPNITYIETIHCQLDKQDEYNVNHGEEVIIGLELVPPFLPEWVLLYVMH